MTQKRIRAKQIISRTLIICVSVIMGLTAFTVTDVNAKSKSVGPGVPKLEAPALLVETTGRYDVYVSWSNVYGASSYSLYRATKKTGKYKLISSGDINKTCFYEDTLKPGKKYYYKVKETGVINGIFLDGEFSNVGKVKIKKRGNGNAKKYNLKHTKYAGPGVLQGKTIVFVGSSLTAGARSKGQAFPEYLSKMYKCKSVKDAKSGITTAAVGGDSFVSRADRLFNRRACPDAFLCQLSVNDATHGVPLGEITADDVRSAEAFNTSTVAGAIEYIVCRSDQKWGCPVAFFTAMNNGNHRYARMVSILYQAQAKWGFQIIDLYNGLGKNSISAKKYRLYMSDRLHPMKAGYKKWVTPYFATTLPTIILSGRRDTNYNVNPEPPADPEPMVEPEPIVDPEPQVDPEPEDRE